MPRRKSTPVAAEPKITPAEPAPSPPEAEPAPEADPAPAPPEDDRFTRGVARVRRYVELAILVLFLILASVYLFGLYESLLRAA